MQILDNINSKLCDDMKENIHKGSKISIAAACFFIYKNAKKAYVNAQDTLNSNIPFISDDMYNKYVELLSLTRLQFYEYEDRFLVTDLRPKEEKEQFSIDAPKHTREITEKWKALNRSIREYISKLDVMEDR